MGNKASSQTSHRPSQSRPDYAHSASSRNPPSGSLFKLPKMGNSNTVKKHVEMAEKTGACQLSKMGLEEFPEDLKLLIGNLRTLDISHNKLSALPPSLGQFTMIKTLQISFNRLTSLPAEIGQLKKLETLTVCGNLLTDFPSTLSNLKSLKTITASQNRFVVFPTVVYALKNLDVIDLSGNRITSVPDGINGIQAIEINLNQNQISVLSETVAECPRLKVLRLEENCLDKAMITPRILKESPISLLALDGNLFAAKDFPHFDGYEEYQERYTATKKKMG